ncbi:MAG: 2-keto-4-pentenoate hydratase [Alphaproteobacteria bacterium]
MFDAGRMAAALIEARRAEGSLTWPEVPGSLDEAYAVLDAIVAQSGDTLGGWKVAMTNPASLEKMKTHEAAYGQLLGSYIYPDGVRLKTGADCMRRVECEYAFRLGRDLPSRTKPYTEAEVADAVATLHPAIEIAHCRLQGAFDVGAKAIIADYCGNYAFIYGEGVADWRGLDIQDQPVTLQVDGQTVATGCGREVLGNPLTSLAFLANKLSARGMGLKAGEFVTTGTTMGMHASPQRCRLVADFGPLGTCTATLIA